MASLYPHPYFDDGLLDAYRLRMEREREFQRRMMESLTYTPPALLGHPTKSSFEDRLDREVNAWCEGALDG